MLHLIPVALQSTTKQNNELDWKKCLLKVTSEETVTHTKCAFVNVHESDAMSQSSRVLFVHSNIDLTYIKFMCVSKTTYSGKNSSHF